MARILISAGHTVMDPGAIRGDLREADLTRKIAPKVITYLQKAKAEVTAVPLDLPLLQRLQWINNTGFSDQAGDLLVEIHINDADGSKRGIEAWYLGEGNNNSHKLAHCIVDVLDKAGYPKQGVRSEFEHELGSLTFLNRSNPTPVLLEALYLDNEQDAALLREDAEMDKLAQNIAAGILLYLGKDAEGNDLPADQLPKFDDLTIKTPEVVAQPAPTVAVPSIPTIPMPVTAPAPPAPVSTPFVSPMASSGVMVDREQRKQMIETYYVKILGRNPSPSDLNYFLNTGIAETELIKKMADSQEHLDLVKSKQELEQLKGEMDKQGLELRRLKATLADQAKMLEHLNGLIAHKNKAIAELERAVFARHGVPSHVLNHTQAPAAAPQTQNMKMKKNFSDKAYEFILKRFS